MAGGRERRAEGGAEQGLDGADVAHQGDPLLRMPAGEVVDQAEHPRLDGFERLAAGRRGPEVGLPAQQPLAVPRQDLGAGEPLPLAERLLAQARLEA